MPHQGNDGLGQQPKENQKEQSKRTQFDSDDKLREKERIKKKSNKKAMKKSKLKQIRKAAEQSVIEAIRKLDENCSIEHSKITVITIKKSSPSLKKIHRKIKKEKDL